MARPTVTIRSLSCSGALRQQCCNELVLLRTRTAIESSAKISEAIGSRGANVFVGNGDP